MGCDDPAGIQTDMAIRPRISTGGYGPLTSVTETNGRLYFSRVASGGTEVQDRESLRISGTEQLRLWPASRLSEELLELLSRVSLFGSIGNPAHNLQLFSR